MHVIHLSDRTRAGDGRSNIRVTLHCKVMIKYYVSLYEAIRGLLALSDEPFICASQQHG